MTDNRMIIATVVGTGIAMTTVIVAFVGIIAGGINEPHRRRQRPDRPDR